MDFEFCECKNCLESSWGQHLLDNFR